MSYFRPIILFCAIPFFAVEGTAWTKSRPRAQIHSARSTITQTKNYCYVEGYSGYLTKEAVAIDYLKRNDPGLVSFCIQIVSRSSNVESSLFAFDVLIDKGVDVEDLNRYRGALLERFGDPVMTFSLGCELWELKLSEHLEEALARKYPEQFRTFEHIIREDSELLSQSPPQLEGR